MNYFSARKIKKQNTSGPLFFDRVAKEFWKKKLGEITQES